RLTCCASVPRDREEASEALWRAGSCDSRLMAGSPPPTSAEFGPEDIRVRKHVTISPEEAADRLALPLDVDQSLRGGDEARALDEIRKALAVAGETDERYLEPELHRLRGEILRAKDQRRSARSTRRSRSRGSRGRSPSSFARGSALFATPRARR